MPSFFIVGPPRTGTSWLHDTLSERTLLPSLTKETRFFDEHFHRGLRWYRGHYPSPNGRSCVGEVAPTYFASPAARERIRALLPSAKIICIFRNPIERVLSLYRVKRAYGMIPWSFEEAMLLDSELCESSRYTTHLRAWIQAFGEGQVLPTLYDDLKNRPQEYVDTIADFIDIPRFSLTRAQMRNVHSSETMTQPRSYRRTRRATMLADWLKARHFGNLVSVIKGSPLGKFFLGGGHAFTGLSRDVSLAIQAHYQQEVEELERMLGRDLSAWKPLRADVQPRELRELLDQGSAAA